MTQRDVPRLDAEAVAAWLALHGVDLTPPYATETLTGGRSNLTFKLVDSASRAVVVRRPPLGRVLESAHDMGREWRYLSVLGSTTVPVPAGLALCDEIDVIGAPFLVMEFVEGVVLHRAADAESMDPSARARASISLVDAMAALHTVDPASVGVDASGATGYVRRQIERWTKQCEATAAATERPIPASVLDGARRLTETVPSETPVGIVHGDFRLGNCILRRDGSVAAVVDWEMATVGAVFSDLGWLLASWFEPDEPGASTSPTSLAGFGPRAELVRRYADQTSFDLRDLDYFVAMGKWKAAGVLSGVAARTEAGAYGGKRDASHIYRNAERMAAGALEVLDGKVSYLVRGSDNEGHDSRRVRRTFPVTDARPAPLHVGRVGLWSSRFDMVPMTQAQELAAELEELGYAMLWLPEVAGRDPFVHAAMLLAATNDLVVATGIASIWARDAVAMNAAHRTLTEAFPERFVLGLGVSHQNLVEDLRGHVYAKPLTAMRTYLERMDSSPFTGMRPDAPPRRVLGALGTGMLRLAAAKADGAHPYFMPPEHTAQARDSLGAGPLLCPEQAVLLERDPARAREVARKHTTTYLGQPNYVNNLKRLGFSDADVADGGSDRLVDALVAWGDLEDIRARVLAHLDAGADHVCVQPLTEGGRDVPAEQWRQLAPALVKS